MPKKTPHPDPLIALLIPTANLVRHGPWVDAYDVGSLTKCGVCAQTVRRRLRAAAARGECDERMSEYGCWQWKPKED